MLTVNVLGLFSVRQFLQHFSYKSNGWQELHIFRYKNTCFWSTFSQVNMFLEIKKRWDSVSDSVKKVGSKLDCCVAKETGKCTQS